MRIFCGNTVPLSVPSILPMSLPSACAILPPHPSGSRSRASARGLLPPGAEVQPLLRPAGLSAVQPLETTQVQPAGGPSRCSAAPNVSWLLPLIEGVRLQSHSAVLSAEQPLKGAQPLEGTRVQSAGEPTRCSESQSLRHLEMSRREVFQAVDREVD